MNHFIVATHSRLASGFRASVDFFFPGVKNIVYVDAYTEDNDFEGVLIELLDKHKHDNVIVLTDLKGGSINQVAARLLPNHNFQLISGVNLPLLLQLIPLAEEIGKQEIENAIQLAREDIYHINSLFEG